MCTHPKMLQVHVSGLCCSDMPPRVNWCFSNCATPIWGWFCPCAVSHEVAATYPWNMYMQHFHVCANVVILSLLHVPTTWLMHVASACTTHSPFCRWNMSLQHVPATCPYNMTPLVCPPLETPEKVRYNTVALMGLKPIASAMAMQCSINPAMKPLIWEQGPVSQKSRNFMSHFHNIPFASQERRGLKSSKFTVIFLFVTVPWKQTKRSAFRNKWLAVSLMAFQAWKVFMTFEKLKKGKERNFI